MEGRYEHVIAEFKYNFTKALNPLLAFAQVYIAAIKKN